MRQEVKNNMSDDYQIEIPIPSDDEGYVLLQCEHCGNLFKITPSDAEDDAVLDVFCPSCGLTSESYCNEDVLELAERKISNFAEDLIYDMFKDLEKSTRNSAIRFEVNGKPSHEAEEPIRSGIEALEIAHFSCCKRTAKVKPLLKITGCYCPFCGVKEFEVK